MTTLPDELRAKLREIAEEEYLACGLGDEPASYSSADFERATLAAYPLIAEHVAKRYDEFRDAVLNQRGALAENGMTNDQINDVLAEFDAIERAFKEEGK